MTTNYLTEALAASFADVVWSVPYGDANLIVPILFEHLAQDFTSYSSLRSC